MAERTLWMFPRNIRAIDPWKLSSITSLLNANANIDLRDTTLQLQYYNELSNLGIKGVNKSISKNPGGMRTYIAQLECLGIIVRRENDFYLTLAGEEFVKGINALDVMRYQMLRLQFPSVYSNSTQVKISRSVVIRPLLFLVKLMQDPDICYLTSKEICIPVIYARKDKDYKKCKEKILQLRAGKELIDLIDQYDDLSTARNPIVDASNIDKRLKDIGDIANTAKNYLQAAMLIKIENSEERVERYVVSNDFEVQSLIKKISAEKIEDYDEQYEENFQRRFGRYINQKDTRTISRIQSTKVTNGFETLVQSKYIFQLSQSPYFFKDIDFIKEIAKSYNKSEQIILDAIRPLTVKRNTIEEQKYLKFAESGGKESIPFEKATAEIFRKLGFEDSIQIGQKKPKENRRGGFPDVFIKISNETTCGFADCKASSKYGNGLDDQDTLEKYYKTSWKDPVLPQTSGLDYFIYIAGGFSGQEKTIISKIKDSQNRAMVPVSFVTARALLDLLSMPESSRPNAKQIKQQLMKSEYFVSGQQFITK